MPKLVHERPRFMGGVLLPEQSAPGAAVVPDDFVWPYAKTDRRLYFMGDDDVEQKILTLSDLAITVGTGLSTTAPALDMSALDGTYQRVVPSGNLTISTSNKASGRRVTVFFLNGASSRTLTWPSGWHWLGTSAPASLAINKVGVLSVFFLGTAETDGVASWGVEP